MKRFYNGLTRQITTPGPARPVFRSSSDFMLLTNSLRLDANGAIHLPGGSRSGRRCLSSIRMANTTVNSRNRLTPGVRPTTFSKLCLRLCRKSVENEPLHIFLVLNDVDRGADETHFFRIATRLISSYRTVGVAVLDLGGFAGTLSETSINLFLDLATQSGEIHDSLVRADAIGSAQALVGMWEILCRERDIPVNAQNQAFASILTPFVKVRQSADVFDAGRNGVQSSAEFRQCSRDRGLSRTGDRSSRRSAPAQMRTSPAQRKICCASSTLSGWFHSIEFTRRRTV